MNGFALGLGLKKRLRETRKWAISLGLDIMQLYCFQGKGLLFCCLFYCFLSQSGEALRELQENTKNT